MNFLKKTFSFVLIAATFSIVSNAGAECQLHSFKPQKPIVLKEKTFVNLGSLIGLTADCQGVQLPRLHIQMRSEYALTQLFVSNAQTSQQRVYVNSSIVDLKNSSYNYTFPLSDRFNRLDAETKLELSSQGYDAEILSVSPEVVN
jgi:hypothetical protein